ncbi:acyl-CoA thioesterase [Hwanghaeella grinnelliae]|uniref:Acyl-CoA thioesterase n=1 Tax=Hwanghaeella grinnelliae TaxID=2500179 RepID=A0A3S2ZCN4_9PROT|nr:thioesterase family protein [Hwanghaeella grinnelliae]RVU39461.1 acyl-CoA thioesterase [Hwanghaeella grinnelliae]
MTVYKTPITVLFRHCDVAGIVFYPRYVEMVNDVIERWLDEALGCSFKQMHLELNAGIPTVKLEVEYLAPASLGDVLEFQLTLRDLGKSSFKTRIIAMHGETKVMEVRSTLVWVKSGNAFKGEGAMKAQPLPADIRGNMEKFLEVDPKDFIQIAEGDN